MKSLKSFATGLTNMVSGASPSDVYDFPFPLHFTEAMQSRVPNYRYRGDLFPYLLNSRPSTQALAADITAVIRNYCDEVEELFQLDKDSDVVRINSDAKANDADRVAGVYGRISSDFCDDMMALWGRGWDGIRELGVDHLFEKTPDEAVVKEIGVLAYDMAVILILMNAYRDFFSAQMREGFGAFLGTEAGVACLVVARRCLPPYTSDRIDALVGVYNRSAKPSAKLDLKAAVETLRLTEEVAAGPADPAAGQEGKEVQKKEVRDVFRAPTDLTHEYATHYIVVKVGQDDLGVPVGYVPIGPPLLDATGHLQAFTNRMADLFPMLVGTMLPPATPTLAEVAGPGVLRDLGLGSDR